MLGIRYIKAQPNTYLIHYKKGKICREGVGLSFFYYAPVTSLIAIPLASEHVPFILEETTSDFQEVTLQGQVAFRIQEPKKISRLMNFTLAPDNLTYLSEDPEKLPRRIIDQVQVLMRDALHKIPLKTALKSTDSLTATILEGMRNDEMLLEMGIQVLSLSILAIKPNPDTARALEAEMREQLLLQADEAIYTRRNACVEQERIVKENELNTEIAVEAKKRQIRETRIEADRVIQEKRQTMQQEEMTGLVTLEDKRKELVQLAVENKKAEAEAQAFGISAAMEAFKNVEPKVMQALASVGMKPAQLIAGAFQNLADNAQKIGNLNIAPELLQELISANPQVGKVKKV